MMKRRTFIKSAGMTGAALTGRANMLPSVLLTKVSVAPKPNGRPDILVIDRTTLRRDVVSDAARFVALHQFEKTQRVAHSVDFADLVGVNSRNRD